ncbi:MAG: methionine--tRNA ligase [Nanoarchaeota archaeon]|nr:methionine--tRNA ligase [Nanoarchaeota archaeon]
MTKKKFYVTTAIDYVNAEPHIGHAYQKIIADVLARWHKLKGEDVFFLTGTDEHGQKIANAAKENGKSPKEFVDKTAVKFEKAWKTLNLDFDRFIRTTDKDHEKKVKDFIKLLEKKGDIYKGEYSGLYCEGCEAYYTEKDLIDGKCKFHPNREIMEMKEESYFFKLSRYEKKLLGLYKKNKKYILPKFREPEIVNRVKEGLKDLSITRSKKNLQWGIDFPLDNDHVLYVWSEALLNYITGIDWPSAKFKKYWPADVEVLGIDNGWFHCVIWPAMLFSAGIKPANTILINGFLTFNGQKISKSLGNAIGVQSLVDKYGADAIRYYVSRNFVFGQDGDFSEKGLVDRHNNELLNKLGNLVSRVSNLAEKNGIEKTANKLIKKLKIKEIEKLFDNFEFDKVLNEIFGFIDVCNEYVQENELWKSKDKKKLYELIDSIKDISILLWSFIPETCEKIAKDLNFKIDYKELGKGYKVQKVVKGKNLFLKIEYVSSGARKPKVSGATEPMTVPAHRGGVKGSVGKEDSIEGVLNMKEVGFSDWEKIDLRVGQIVKAEDIDGADKLFKLTVDLGKKLGKRTLAAGIKEFYSKGDLKGKKCIVFVNLQPRELKGVKSEGMLLAASSEDHSKVVLIGAEGEVELGSRVS